MATVVTPTVAAAVAPPSNRAFPLRILVDSDVVGAIIGRSGGTIRSITQQTKARIDVHREESPDQKEKVITISGNPDNCSEALYEILKICHNEYNSHKLYRDEMNDLRDCLPVDGTNPELDTLQILAPSNMIGRLIGRGGASIKKIMEQTSTKIKISVNAISESTGEHTITIVGKLDRIGQAERLISSKLRSAYFSDMNISLHAFNQQPYLFNNVPMPYVAPGSYGSHQSSLLASMVNPQTSHTATSMSRSVPMNHTHHQSQLSSQMYPGPPTYLPLYQNINVPHSTSGGLMNFNSVVPRFEQERETVYIYIPSTMVGAIIGKSGSAIKEMISASGATIKVETTSPPIASAGLESPATSSVENRLEINKTKQQNPSDLVAESPNSMDPTSTKDQILGTPEDVDSPSVGRKSAFVRPKNTNPSDNSMTRRVTVFGYPASQYTAQYLIYRKVSIESGKSDLSLMVEIHVPSNLVGKIIGKGGTSVKNLRKQTRTTIRLPEERQGQTMQTTTSNDEPSSSINGNNSNSETIVQITGKFEGSQAAQRYIRDMIRESQYSKQGRSKLTTMRNNDTQRISNAQTNSIINEEYNRQQENTEAELSPDSVSEDKSSHVKEASTDKTELLNDRSAQEKVTENPPKTESLPSNCCDHFSSDGSRTLSTEEKTPEGKSHSTGTADVLENGQSDGHVISNNNTITNLKLSKNELPTDSTLSQPSDKMVTMSKEELKSYVENGDTIHKQVINTSATH